MCLGVILHVGGGEIEKVQRREGRKVEKRREGEDGGGYNTRLQLFSL